MPNLLRRLAISPVLLALGASICGCAAITASEKANRIRANVYEADRQLTLGNDAGARTWYDRAIAISPRDPATYTGFDEDGNGGVVTSMERHYDWPDIVTYISKAVQDKNLAAEPFFWEALAEAQQRLGDNDAARESYERELSLFTGASYKKGSSLTAMDPDILQLRKANAEWGTGQHDQAAKDFNAIAASNPGQAVGASAQNNLAYLEAVANERLPEAYRLATTAVKTARQNSLGDETLGEYLDTLGWVEYRMGKNEDAARDLEEAIGDIPREPVSHYHLACVYHALNLDNDAKIELDCAYQLCPTDADTLAMMKTLGVTPGPVTPA